MSNAPLSYSPHETIGFELEEMDGALEKSKRAGSGEPVCKV
jgi:hypothetical protein